MDMEEEAQGAAGPRLPPHTVSCGGHSRDPARQEEREGGAGGPASLLLCVCNNSMSASPMACLCSPNKLLVQAGPGTASSWHPALWLCREGPDRSLPCIPPAQGSFQAWYCPTGLGYFLWGIPPPPRLSLESTCSEPGAPWLRTIACVPDVMRSPPGEESHL